MQEQIVGFYLSGLVAELQKKYLPLAQNKQGKPQTDFDKLLEVSEAFAEFIKFAKTLIAKELTYCYVMVKFVQSNILLDTSWWFSEQKHSPKTPFQRTMNSLPQSVGFAVQAQFRVQVLKCKCRTNSLERGARMSLTDDLLKITKLIGNLQLGCEKFIDWFKELVEKEIKSSHCLLFLNKISQILLQCELSNQAVDIRINQIKTSLVEPIEEEHKLIQKNTTSAHPRTSSAFEGPCLRRKSKAQPNTINEIDKSQQQLLVRTNHKTINPRRVLYQQRRYSVQPGLTYFKKESYEQCGKKESDYRVGMNERFNIKYWQKNSDSGVLVPGTPQRRRR